MTNALLMNIFMMSEPHSMPVITNPLTENKTNKSSKEKSYLKAAQSNAKQARTEMKHGGEALKIAETSESQKFIRIAHWHFERCAVKAGKAEKYFLAAQKILASRTRREYCRLRALEMSELAIRSHYLESTIFAENHLTIN